MINLDINMKKIYFLAIVLLTLSLSVCKAEDYQPGFVILKNGKHVSGLIKLYKNAPWKNQEFIWFKDSAAYAANPSVAAKKYYSSDLSFYQAGSRQFVKVHYIDQANIKLRNLYTNSSMLERVSNGRFVAYMYYSYPPEFFDYFFADPKGDQTEPAGNDNAMQKYRIIFKKNNAKHFVNAYSYGLAKYFKDTPEILQKYSSGSYGNQADVEGSFFTRIPEICNRTIFTSHEETKGIIAAFNDYNNYYAPKITPPVPTPTPSQSTADLFKPYLFKGTIVDNNTHKGISDATVSYVDSATQQTVKQTLTDSVGTYVFNVLDKRPFGIKVEKKGFFTQNLTGADASTGVSAAGILSGASAGGSSARTFAGGSSAAGGPSAGLLAGGSAGSLNGGSSANGGGSNNGSANSSATNGNGSNNGAAVNGNGSNNDSGNGSAVLTGGSSAAANGTTGVENKHLSAKYYRYIHSSRYKHSIYYKEHLQYERELAKQNAASAAAGTAGSANNGTLANGDGSANGGSNNGALANNSGSANGSANNGSANGGTNNGSANNGSANNGASANGSGSANSGYSNDGTSNGGAANNTSSQALAVNGKIADGAFVSPAIRLQAYVVNKPIVISNILYDYGFATLRPESITVLDGLVKTMVDNPNIVIQLSAHTDSIGSDAYNLKLSQNRAQSCVDYMLSKGISTERISAIGYGKSRPIAPNSLPNGQDNPDGRQLNRRIEFVVLNNTRK